MPSLLTPFLDGEEKKIMISDGTETIKCGKKNRFLSHMYMQKQISRVPKTNKLKLSQLSRGPTYSQPHGNVLASRHVRRH